MINIPEQGSDENPDLDGFYLFHVVKALERMGIWIDERRLLEELRNRPEDED
jgi:hypothetical protein